MAIQINVKFTVKELSKSLNRLEKKMIPKVTSDAINTTIKQVEKELLKQLPKKIDRPTPFTMKSFRIFRSSRFTQKGSIFFNRIQWEYMKFAVVGGLGKDRPVPVGRKTNKFGNIPGRRKMVNKGKKELRAAIKGIDGI